MMTTEQGSVESIAIVGMAGRFPGAPDVDTFWSNLCAGVESVLPFSEAELEASGADIDDPGFVNAGAQMEGVEEFDADFFGMGRREAELTDPQHRIVLETAWNTLEHAGYDPGWSGGRIGVFGGVGRNQYLRYNLLTHPELLGLAGDYPIMLGNEREYAILRAAFKLGLEGPAVPVNTACSTSGVAIHLAVQSLLAGECDLALAGGARVVVPLRAGYVYQEGHIFSADGHVRAFDADAQGTVIAGGVAFIALKRLDDAIADSDTIYAVIRGSAINNDGAARIGFTAPSIDGQAAVIEDALAVADADADSVGMVEAHGTGTLLGDPIEVTALTQAYRRQTRRRGYCALGSLKSNIGHLDAAAGVAGVIKAALSLYHGQIPPSINYRSPNPQIDFDSSPFFVNTELRPWPRAEPPRRAGVSSFGLGGTNAHIVLEEAPITEPRMEAPSDRPHVLTLSAKTPEALEQRERELADHLAADPDADLTDAAYTLAVGRSRLPCRAAVVAVDTESAVQLLRQPTRRETAKRTSTATGAEVAFLFPGTGAQYVGMGASLYRSEPVFAEAMEACASIVGEVDGYDLIDLLYGEHADPEAATAVLMGTSMGQPAIFALQWALSRLWASWGIEPAALVGHSVGELAAACIGGLFPLEDALRLIAVRGRLMQDLPEGAMTAISAEEAAILPLLDGTTSLAAVNASRQCVAAGPPGAIDDLERRLTAADIPFRRLPISVAGHSPMMEPVLDPLRVEVAGTARDELDVPMVSTLTGTWTTTAEIGDPEYWGRHARGTVRYADAVGVLLADRPDMVLLEIGPGETLTALVRQHPAASPANAPISSLPGRAARTDDRIYAYRGLADAWAAGADVDWDAVTGGARRRIPLPTYPFVRQRYWVEARATAAQTSPAGFDTADVASTPAFRQEAMPVAGGGTAGPTDGVVAQLTAMLAELSGLDETALDPATSFTDLGFDSLFLAQFNSQSRKRFGVRIALDQLLTDTSTIDSLAASIEAKLEAAPSQAAGPSPAGGDVDGVAGIAAPGAESSPDRPIAIPLLPNVARYMVERDTPHPEHWNVSALLTPSDRMDPETTGRVVAALIERHDALRLRICRNGADYQSSIAPATDPLPFGVSDLSSLDPTEQPGAVERRADELQAGLDLEHGPLMRVELFELGERGQRLLVVVHHFVFDQLSWRPFWEDFLALYEELEGGGAVTLPPPVTSYEAWAEALQRRADSDALHGEMRVWTDLPWDRVQPVPLDHPHGANTNGSAEHVELVFSREETTALLRGTPGVVRKADLMLTALARTTATWTGSDTVLIDLMGHGRDEAVVSDADPMDSVGFFISYTPLVLRLPADGSGSGSSSLTDQIEPLLRRGLDFDLLRYMASDAGVRLAFRDLPRAQILFNHHGKLDAPEAVPRGSMFCAAPESSGRTHDPSGLRYYPLAVESKIHYGRLRLAFIFSTNLHERSTIAALSDEFHDQLTSLVAEASVA